MSLFLVEFFERKLLFNLLLSVNAVWDTHQNFKHIFFVKLIIIFIFKKIYNIHFYIFCPYIYTYYHIKIIKKKIKF